MDSIANMLAQMKNAIGVKKDSVEIPHAKIKEEIARILLIEGYIARYDVHTRMNKKFIKIALKYTDNRKSVVSDLKRVSKSSRRIYVGRQAIPRIQSGYGTVILSTPQGLMTDGEARKKKLGGEVICYVW